MVVLLQAEVALAQLTTSGGGPVSANALVSNLIGQGVSFSNASYTGRDVAIGTFNGVSSNIGLNSGVIITSGHINVAPGPNNNGGASYSNNGPNIQELEILAQSVTYDGAILEFDFVPQSNLISFRYVFASEEYNEYVCSEFNDAFAFFITGPGIMGAENLAVVPSTTLPVTINTINNGLVGALGSASNSPCELGNSAYFVGNTLQTVQYDGFTTVLTAQRAVIPCQTYHIRLMIADGADDIFDSAVFLEENSFNSATYTISVSTPSNDSTIFEGCTSATLTFSRPNADPTPMTINYAVNGSATPGVDYNALPGVITIPAGQSDVSITVSAIADGINEGTETISIRGLTNCGDIPVDILIKEKPPVLVNIPTRSLCNGSGPVTLTANVFGGMQPYTWLWDNGATTASIAVNPSGPTNYQVTVSDACGTTVVQTTTVAVAPIPTASIGVPPFVCSGIPLTVAYTGTATPAATYLWDFDNPTTVSSGSDQGPYQISWDSSGTKTIRLQVIENGCSSQVVTAQTIVNPTPTAVFEVDPIVCAGQIATVTYTGTGTDMGGYGWGFPGGVIITGGRRGPFEIRWDSAGVHGITLTVTENGCTSPGAQQFVNVRPTPATDFTVQSPLCLGQPSTITYNGQASSAAIFNWNFAGGTVHSGNNQGPFSVSWNSPGTKNVFLTVSENGCTGRVTNKPVTVLANPTGNFTIGSPICAGQPTTVTYTGTAANTAQYQWDFAGATVLSGTGQGPYSIRWDNPGNYALSLLVNEQGCNSAAYTAIALVNPEPIAQFVLVGPVCTGEATTVSYTGPYQNGGASFFWDFNNAQLIAGSGAGPYTIYWDTPGNKQVTLSMTSPEGCPSQPMTNTIMVNTTPTATFTAETPVCIKEASTLQYIGSANPSANYQWNLAGGQIINGSGQGPLEVIWTTAGIKNISLSVTENGCNAPVLTQQVRVKPLPTGYFTVVTPVCAGSPSSVMYAGTAAPNALFVWDFDQGSVLSGSGPGPYQVSWDLHGPKNISLTVTEDGCTAAPEVKQVQILPVPGNSFTLNGPLCIGAPATLTYTGNAFPTATYNWNFDGATLHAGQGAGPYQLSWSSPGLKRVSLQIDQAGCPSIPSFREVMVYPIPEAPFHATDSVCSGQEAQIIYDGIAGTQAFYHWNFQGATVLSGSGRGPFSVLWNSAGEKNIQLTVEENGCRSLPANFQTQVYSYPTAVFEADPFACQGTESTVTFTGAADNQAIFNWNFDGASIVSGSGRGPYRLKWENPGTKSISLDLSQHGCAAPPANSMLTVAPSPVADAGADQIICSGETVQLGAAAQTGYAYSWQPGSGLNNAALPNPLFSVRNQQQDTLRLELVLTTSLGACTDYDTVLVNIRPEPHVRLQVPQGQCYGSHSFAFSAEAAASQNVQYHWDFGPQANIRNSNLPHPANIRYPEPGVYPVRLDFEIDGCPGISLSDSVMVYAMPEAMFTGNHLEGCPPLKARLLNQSIFNQNYQYVWDMGNGETVNAYQPDYTFTSEGQFSITLKVLNEFGCAGEFSMHSLVNVFPVPRAGFQINPEELSTEHPLANITDQSVGAVSWRYLTGTGAVVNQPSFTWLYPEKGVYQISQVVTNKWGCKDSVLKKLNVKPLMTFYVPNAFTPNDDGDNDYFRCYGLNIEEFSMSIFTRWGELVFHTNDIMEGWDGRVQNDPDRKISQMDVYAVLIYVKDHPDLPPRRIDHRVTLVK